jgi:hypothetical protein
MKLVTTTTLLVSVFAATSLQAKWSRIPIMKEKPVDIATAAPGSSASLDSSSGFGKVDSLLSEDITAAATVSAGKSFAVINLGKPVLISQSSFVNDGIEGRATLSASADKTGWAVLEEKVFSAADRTVEFKFAGIQAKFVKLEFALSKGGLIRNLRLFGGQSDRGYAVKQDAEGKQGKPMDFLGGLGGSRIVYLAPKPAGGVDTAVTYNKLAFPESDEKYRTVIYDLGQLRILNQFASVHSPRPVRFEVFAFDNLPEKEDWRGHLAFNPEEFNNAKPVAVAEDRSGAGEITAKPSKPVKTRYLALRWEPEFNPPDFQCTASGSGNAVSIQTTNTIVVTNADGTKSKITVTVGDAPGAGAGSSEVRGETPAQVAAQGNAAMSDTSTVVIQTYAAGVDPLNPGTATPIKEVTQTGTSTVTIIVDSSTGTVTTTSESTSTDGNGNTQTTTVQEVKTADGNTTTTVTQSTTTPDGTTTQTNVNTGSGGNNSANQGSATTGTTDGSGNLGGGNGSPAPNGGGATSVSTTTADPNASGSSQ